MQELTLLQKIEALQKCQRVAIHYSGTKSQEPAPFIAVRFLDDAREAMFNWFHRDDNGNLTFDHTYSQNTGQSTRGLRRRLVVEEMIEHAYTRWCVTPKLYTND